MGVDSDKPAGGRRAALVYSSDRAGDDAVRSAVLERIQRYGVLAGECRLPPPEDPAAPEPCAAGAPAPDADLLVVLGGDGTLIQASRLHGALGLPFLGVNSGRVGFMAQFEPDAFLAQASDLLGASELAVQQYARIGGSLYNDGATAPAFASQALNEFVVTAGPPFRMITLQITIDDRPGPRVSGDGIIVSTPIGSTAYNVSAGGPIIEPRVDGVVITPIAAHSLSFRPIVVSRSSRIEITVLDANHAEGGGTTLVVDGQVRRPMGTNDRLVLTSDVAPVGFVQNPGVSYWQTLIEKMHWAAPPRARG